MSRKEKITPEQVRHLGELSRLSLTSKEEESLGSQLSEILEYFEILDKVSIPRDIPPYRSPSSGVAREDTPKDFDSDSILSGVPHRKGRYVKAPRVF